MLTTTMTDEKRLRELCARALQAEGADFYQAIKELGKAIDAREEANENNGRKKNTDA